MPTTPSPDTRLVFEVTHEQLGLTHSLARNVVGSTVPSPELVRSLVFDAFGMEPSGEYQLCARGGARIGEYAVRAS